MDIEELLQRITKGRTDLVFELLARPDWQKLLASEPVGVLDWFVFHDDVTALKAVLAAGGDLTTLDLDASLQNAAFFGHWKVCDFLLLNGANPRHSDD